MQTKDNDYFIELQKSVAGFLKKQQNKLPEKNNGSPRKSASNFHKSKSSANERNS